MTDRPQDPPGSAEQKYPYDADELRALPLEKVFLAFKAKQDTGDKASWNFSSKGDQRRFLVRKNQMFTDVDTHQTGRGAIDLVCRLKSCGFITALQYLEQIKRGEPIDKLTSHPGDGSQPMLPTRSDANLPVIRKYLCEDRKISPALYEALIQSNRLYADYQGNVVMVMRNLAGEASGAEIRPRHDPPRGVVAHKYRYSHGTDPSSGAFFVHGSQEKGRIVLVANGIEAMSYGSLMPADTAISLGDFVNHKLMDWLGPSLKELDRPVFAGMPATPAGQEGSRVLLQRFSFSQVDPSSFRKSATDWNSLLEILVSERLENKPVRPELPKADPASIQHPHPRM